MVQKERLKNGLKAVSLPVLGFEKIEVAKKISSTEVRASVVAKAQTDLETLKGFWSETMKGLKVGKELEMKWWDILTDLYSQDWRYYHVLKHVKNMLIIAKDHKEKLKHFPGFELAAWFHDSVYYPALAKNEEESSKLFKEFSKEAGIDEKLAEYVTNLIIATESHSIKSDAEYDTKLFVDTDLSILGETKEDYEKYAECVRKEYSHVSKEEYEKGRLAVLNKFLKEGSPLFNTEEMREKYEARARENIMNEIKTLSQLLKNKMQVLTQEMCYQRKQRCKTPILLYANLLAFPVLLLWSQSWSIILQCAAAFSHTPIFLSPCSASTLSSTAQDESLIGLGTYPLFKCKISTLSVSIMASLASSVNFSIQAAQPELT
eukprot:TRINITY_DN923_c0_g1_i1.p3 TRINITY_DN923_c0_g1~~TRINITY_DN923_c0_g1_i1.p3  ORF type:complete len:376 (-),score=34.57 TRINITY_DN923_c0_g1_i1:3279-4406(-)